MIDKYGREIDYLRISLTDRCNLRCIYCMPEEGVKSLSHAEILTYDEILRICRCAADLGIRKIKLTGGEPLVRKGCASLAKQIKAIPGIEKVTLTTNGILLAEQLADARLERLGPGRGPLDADRVGGHLDHRDGDVRQGFSFACLHIVSRRSGADCWSLAAPGPGASVAPGRGRPCCSLLPQTAAKDNHFPGRDGPRPPQRPGAHRGSLRGRPAV